MNWLLSLLVSLVALPLLLAARLSRKPAPDGPTSANVFPAGTSVPANGYLVLTPKPR